MTQFYEFWESTEDYAKLKKDYIELKNAKITLLEREVEVLTVTFSLENVSKCNSYIFTF